MDRPVQRGIGIFLAVCMLFAGWVYLLWLHDSGFRGYEALIFLGFGVGAFGWLVAGPVGRAIKRMLGDEPAQLPVEQSAEFYDLQDQVQALSLEMQRMRELEDRLDFAERLLTQQAESDRGDP